MKSDTREVHGPCCREGSQTKYRLRPHASITSGGGQEEQEQQVLGQKMNVHLEYLDCS